MKRLIPCFTGLMLTLVGCTSTWENMYTPVGERAPALPADAAVTLREVPWERVQATLGELEKERAASDVHPDEWTDEQKGEAKTKLLRGLQVSADPAAVRVLGRSVFRSTERVQPNSGELEAFARKIGATMVVWSSTYLGKTEKIVQEPVSQYSTGTDRYRDDRGRRRTDSYTENSTLWVPVVVKADEHAWTAYFLRENDAVMFPR